MIIDTSQGRNFVAVSYAAEDGSIGLKKFDVEQINGIGMYDYEICDASDPEVEPVLHHFKENLPIKKVQHWKFDFDELREFLLKVIPEEDRKDIFAYRSPDMYMGDIEIDIEDGEIFPDPHKADFPIDSIQITAPNLHTVTLTTNSRAKNDQAQMMRIEDTINDHYENVEFVWEKTKRLKYAHIVFDTEVEMLEYFWKMVRQKLHSIAFWGGTRFDVPYLNNRCAKIGVDMSLGSPTGEVSRMHDWPKHRYVFDYMQLVSKWAWDLQPLLSVALDYVSKKIFDVGKIPYEGSYKDLYDGPVEQFLLYGAVDTIAMQLIHHRKKYTAAKDSLVYYTKTSLFDANKVTAQVHALCWDELYIDNKINAEPFEKKDKEHFEGGYVKQPTRKFVMFPVCEDFSALYPRIIQSFNMSFENFEGSVRNKEHAKELTAKGYYVSVNGHYYKNDRDYTLKRVETKLLDERYSYKNLMSNIYLDVMTPIENELKRRGIKPKV